MVGALFALAGALSYSELGINFPSSGGEYVYLTRAYGPTWGFMTRLGLFLRRLFRAHCGRRAGIRLLPLLFLPRAQTIGIATRSGRDLFPSRSAGRKPWPACWYCGFTILNCFGVGRTAKVQNVLTGTKIVVIVSFIVLGFLAGNGNWDHFSMPTARTSTTALPAQFVISLLWVMVAYSGWNAATYVAEELRRPERTLPAALAVGTALVTALFLGLNLIYIYSTPLEQMKGVVAVGSLAASNLFGPQVAGIFSAADGDLDHVDRQRHGHDRPARLLRDGEEQGVLQSGGSRASEVAHARRRHPVPGRVQPC